MLTLRAGVRERYCRVLKSLCLQTVVKEENVFGSAANSQLVARVPRPAETPRRRALQEGGIPGGRGDATEGFEPNTGQHF